MADDTLAEGYCRCGICDLVIPKDQWFEHTKTKSYERMAAEYTHLYSFGKEEEDDQEKGTSEG